MVISATRKNSTHVYLLSVEVCYIILQILRAFYGVNGNVYLWPYVNEISLRVITTRARNCPSTFSKSLPYRI
jgi:hypothetical protein